MFAKKTLLDWLGKSELAALIILIAAWTIPFFTNSPAVISILSQIMIGTISALSVYIMMRMDLMTFAVPAFMAIGGYTSAIASLNYGITDVVQLVLLSFSIPLLIALPLGIMVLRLRGVYFILVTFIIAEIVPLILFETPQLTGGANGLSGLPIISFFSYELATNRDILFLCTSLALLACLLTVLLTRIYRAQFAAIEENEVLAQSLGLVVWRYKVVGFCFSAGLGGLSGLALVNMLLTAHPSSFAAFSSVDYIVYTIVGGKGSILGPLIGSSLLVWASNIFSFRGAYSPGLFGLLLIVVILGMRGGITGAISYLYERITNSASFKSAAKKS